MKRILASILTCLLIVLVSLTASGDAFAGQLIPAGIRNFFAASAVTQSDKDVLTQLQSDVMPQLEAILSPDQVEIFETEIASGTSFRKTFKSLMLMPEQKAQLKSLFKSLPKRDTFASLTPMQKKKLFLEKEAFSPSSDEIIDRINTKIETSGGTLPEGVKEKIDAGVRAKDTFQPSPESIMEKIEAGIDSVKEGLSGE